MISNLSDLPQAVAASVLLFADHLDAVLAYGEDIAASTRSQPELPEGAGVRAVVRRGEAMATFVDTLREREFAVIARLREARERAQEIIGREPRLDLILRMFLSGTAAFADAAATVSADEAAHQDAGGGPGAYLRRRGIDPLAASAAGAVASGEAFLVAGTAPLDVLMDLSATCLDKLDLMFDLYGSTTETGLKLPSEPATEGDGAKKGTLRLTPEAA